MSPYPQYQQRQAPRLTREQAAEYAAVRYFKVTNADGSTSIQTMSGHQHAAQDVPENGIELTEQQGLNAQLQAEQAHDRRESERLRAQLTADADLAGWRTTAAARLVESGMPAEAIAAVTGVPVAAVSVPAPDTQEEVSDA